MPRIASVEDSAILADKEAGMKIVAGIDVGKRELVVSVSGGPVRSFKNEVGGIRGLAEWLRTEGVEQVVCEATGATSGGWFKG